MRRRLRLSTAAAKLIGINVRILIAEDDSTLSDALERSLRMSGHAVDRAADGESALQLLDTGEFDLLILDHGLPRLDGTEVLERARQLSGRLAVILISAAEDAALRVRRRGLSVDAFLIKPFGLDAWMPRFKGLCAERLRCRRCG